MRTYLFLDSRLAAINRNYPFGFVWLVASILVPGLVVFFLSPGQDARTTGSSMVVAIVISLALVGTLRAARQPGSFRCFWMALVHFVRFAHRQRTPGWVFHSPCGTVHRRRLTFMVCVFLTVIPFVAASDYWTHIILCDASAPLIPDDVLRTHLNDTGFTRFAITVGAALSGERYLAACLAAQLFACISIPILAVILAAFIVAGPAIAAHHEVLEQ